MIINKVLKLKLLLMLFCVGASFVSNAQRVLTIEQALDIAEESNPSMRTTKLSLERTHYSLQAQRAGLKPQFSLRLNPFSYGRSRSFDNRESEWYTNTNTSSEGTLRASVPFLPTDGTLSINNRFRWADNTSLRSSGTTSNNAFSNNLSLVYDQPIFTYNRQKMQLKQLEFDYENAGISYAMQRLTLENNITNQFYRVFMSKNQLANNQEALKNEESNYEIIKYKVDADLSPKEELYQAEVNLATAQSTVEQNIVSLKDLYDNLKQTLGMPLTEEIDVTASVDDIPALLIDPDKAIQHAMASRMELRQREISIELAEMTMTQVKANNEFNGNVSLSLGISGDNKRLENVFDGQISSPSISVSLSVPIFDWGQRKARIQAQKASQLSTQLSYEEQIVSIELAIRSTLRSLDNLRTQIAIQEKNVENSKRQYELQRVRYREGDLTGMQMLQYQQQLTSSQNSLMQRKIDYKNALLTLKIATLYDFEKNEAVVPVKELTKLTVQ